MGIYNNEIDFDPKGFIEGKKKYFKPVLAVVAVLVLLFIAVSMLSTDPLSFYFSKNPIQTSENTVLYVTVVNPTSETVRDVFVTVFAEDKKSISVAPPIKKIDVLDNNRKLEFVINPVGEILPGNYSINIEIEVNGKKYQKKVILTIAE